MTLGAQQGRRCRTVPTREGKIVGFLSRGPLVLVGVIAALAVFFSLSSATKILAAHSEPPKGGGRVPVVISLKNRVKDQVLRGSEAINPVSGEDFFLFVWVKPSRLPSARARAIAVVKFDPQALGRPGFAIALARSGGGVRPEVYWKGNSPRGGWYSFPEFELPPHKWTLLALSYRADRLLGLHAVGRTAAKEARVTLLGGHVVDGSAPPESRVPIDVGAVEGGSSFRGDIGPLGIIAGQRLSEHLQRLLKAIDKDPASPPDLPRSLRMVSFAATPSALQERGEKEPNDERFG